MANALMQARRAADLRRVILLVVAQNAVAVPAEDYRGVVELTAGDVVIQLRRRRPALTAKPGSQYRQAD
jgi:hypothetical protein